MTEQQEASAHCFVRYQKLAARTIPEGRERSELLRNFYMGLFGEGGEVVDWLKKVIHHGHCFDLEKFVDELGDVCWYIAALSTLLETPEHFLVLPSSPPGMSHLRDLQEASDGFQRAICRAAGMEPSLAVQYQQVAVMDCLLFGRDLAQYLGVDLQRVLDHNVEKLLKRYPDGFDQEHSINRKS